VGGGLWAASGLFQISFPSFTPVGRGGRSVRRPRNQGRGLLRRTGGRGGRRARGRQGKGRAEQGKTGPFLRRAASLRDRLLLLDCIGESRLRRAPTFFYPNTMSGSRWRSSLSDRPGLAPRWGFFFSGLTSRSDDVGCQCHDAQRGRQADRQAGRHGSRGPSHHTNLNGGGLASRSESGGKEPHPAGAHSRRRPRRGQRAVALYLLPPRGA
jgi:hypothetical protein